MRPLKNSFSFLTVVITTLTAIVILLLPSLGHAKETGRYISVQQIDIDQNTSIAAGTEVNFLGVIGAVRLMIASIRLKRQSKFMRAIIDATQPEQRHGLA
jgi:hypothetical protein